jgi:hypothetical protein
MAISAVTRPSVTKDAGTIQRKMKKLFCQLLAIALAGHSSAQDTTIVEEDYSKYGDAAISTAYCTQKVLNQSPQRLITLAWEHQFPMNWIPQLPTAPPAQSLRSGALSGIRLAANIPVISKNNIIWQMGASHWHAGTSFTNSLPGSVIDNIQQAGFATTGINTTIFKPLNSKNFLLLQGGADANYILHTGSFSSKAITWNAALLYGWKTSDRNMIGAGIARTYRAGRVLHIPVLLWNKTFTDRWGMELLLPARAHLRYNMGTKSMLQLGYELEGNQYWMNNNPGNADFFVQRGELKPRLMWDQRLFGFFWLQAQAGIRYNWRMDVYNVRNGSKVENRVQQYNLSTPFYFNIGISFVSQ